MKSLALVVVIASVMVGVMGGQTMQVTINNVQSRLDTSGTIMDIHDGNVLLINDTYYWYGASYGLCKEPGGSSGCNPVQVGACGFQLNHNVSLYTSNNLQNWTFRGHVFSATQYAQPAILFCPKVIYNAASKLYVLWTNWVTNQFVDSFYAAAVSDSPMGPFKLVVEQINTGYANTGDFSLFVDDDGAAYVIYTAHIVNYPVTHQMSIERLTPDYLGSEGLSANSGFFGAAGVEAPAMFSGNGIYYAVFGSTCCYCQGGAPAVVHTAPSPLGPYQTASTAITSAVPAQQTDIFPYFSAAGKLQYLWMGDRWQSAPDGIKGHDLMFIAPITFTDNTDIAAIPFDDSFTIDVYVP